MPIRGQIIRALQRRIRRVRRRMCPVSLRQISDALAKFGPIETPTVCVHSSLSACGHIRGGAAAVVAVLRQWAAERTLTMPTHTYCYPDATGKVPVYDPLETPSCVGVITDYFWRVHKVRRSLHPTHSLAADGPDSDQLVADHEHCETPCGHGTPYEKLIQLDCAVLMFGCTMDAYTLFHTAEDAVAVPYLYESTPYRLRYRDRKGHTQDFPMRRQDMKVRRNFAEKAAWLEARGLLARQTLGLGELLFIPHAAAVHAMLLQQLHSNPFFLVADSARPKLAGPHR